MHPVDPEHRHPDQILQRSIHLIPTVLGNYQYFLLPKTLFGSKLSLTVTIPGPLFRCCLLRHARKAKIYDLEIAIRAFEP